MRRSSEIRDDISMLVNKPSSVNVDENSNDKERIANNSRVK